MDLGRRNQRTAVRHAVGAHSRSVPKRERRARFDRQGREMRLKNPDGIPYEACPMCGQRSMVQVPGRAREWQCENGHCGYRDNELQSLN